MTGLPGLWNGPADAFRHAYWNCLMTRSIGADQAKTVADTHEEFGRNHPHERLMDDHNNAMGRLISRNFPSEDCATIVMRLLRSGGLLVIPNYQEVAQSRGKIPPAVPLASNAVPLPPSNPNVNYGTTGYAANNYSSSKTPY